MTKRVLSRTELRWIMGSFLKFLRVLKIAMLALVMLLAIWMMIAGDNKEEAEK